MQKIRDLVITFRRLAMVISVEGLIFLNVLPSSNVRLRCLLQDVLRQEVPTGNDNERREHRGRLCLVNPYRLCRERCVSGDMFFVVDTYVFHGIVNAYVCRSRHQDGLSSVFTGARRRVKEDLPTCAATRVAIIFGRDNVIYRPSFHSKITRGGRPILLFSLPCRFLIYLYVTFRVSPILLLYIENCPKSTRGSDGRAWGFRYSVLYYFIVGGATPPFLE